MATDNTGEPLRVGTLVKIRGSNFAPSPIVEYCGPLGPGGQRVYRVRYRKGPRPGYVEVLEEQLEVTETTVNGSPGSP